MNKDDVILISVDNHIVEPPDMFKNHLPKKYIDGAPRLVHHPDGSDTWQFRDTVIPNALAGRPKEEYGLEPHPGPVHPDGAAGDLGSATVRRRDAPRLQEGCAFADVQNPSTLDCPSSTTWTTGSRCGRRWSTPRP